MKFDELPEYLHGKIAFYLLPEKIRSGHKENRYFSSGNIRNLFSFNSQYADSAGFKLFKNFRIKIKDFYPFFKIQSLNKKLYLIYSSLRPHFICFFKQKYYGLYSSSSDIPKDRKVWLLPRTCFILSQRCSDRLPDGKKIRFNYYCDDKDLYSFLRDFLHKIDPKKNIKLAYFVIDPERRGILENIMYTVLSDKEKETENKFVHELKQIKKGRRKKLDYPKPIINPFSFF